MANTYQNLTEEEVKWLKICQEARGSNLSISEWCRKNNIDRRNYYHWEKKLRDKGYVTTPGVKQGEVSRGESIIGGEEMGYIESLSAGEKKFIHKRQDEYLEDYPDLNDSVDMMSLQILLMQEVHIARLLKQQALGHDVGEDLERAHKLFQTTAAKLGIDRDNRLKRGETGAEGDIASFALSMQSDISEIMKRMQHDSDEEEELRKKRRQSGRDSLSIREEAPNSEEVALDGEED